ncbi:nitrilase-related carbon-nitrogen hydrolase [Pseudoneobacillus sp. C159]
MKRTKTNWIISVFLAILSGTFMFLSMPSHDFGIFAWFGLVPLLVAIRGKSLKHQSILINLTCIIWSVGTHWWYPSIFSHWGYVIMIAGGLFYGAFLKMGIDMQSRIKSFYGILALPITFSVFEWLKTIIPFTKTWWIELLAKSQWTVPENLQILSVTGFAGLTFLILLTNVILTELVFYQSATKAKIAFSLVLLLLPIGNYLYGYSLIKNSQAELASNPVTIAAMVDLINQDEEVLSLGSETTAGDGYLADTPEMKEKIFEINRQLSREMATTEKAPDFIVWGENEFMNTNDENLYKSLMDLSKELNAHFVVDTVWQTDDHMYDTAILTSPKGEEIGRTPKIFTLWGEESYGFSPGPRDYKVYQTEHGKVALAVCWDRHDQSILRNYAKNGARLALIPADDDFYGNEQFPHFAASDAVFRAVENHLAIGSGSTSGVAQVITPYGEMTAKSEVNKRQSIIGDTFLVETQTFYTTYGDVFAYLLSAIFVVMFIISETNKRKRS